MGWIFAYAVSLSWNTYHEFKCFNPQVDKWLVVRVTLGPIWRSGQQLHQPACNNMSQNYDQYGRTFLGESNIDTNLGLSVLHSKRDPFLDKFEQFGSVSRLAFKLKELVPSWEVLRLQLYVGHLGPLLRVNP